MSPPRLFAQGQARRCARRLLTLGLTLSGVILSKVAHARSNEAPFSSCTGCHNGTANPPEISLTFDPAMPAPGDTVTGQVTIKSSNMNVAGFYLTSAVGTLSTLSQGTKMSAGGITHDSPLEASGGQVQFSFEWALPAEMGGTAIAIRAISANDDGRSQGDTAGAASFPIAWGCELVVLYADLDRDGFGTENFGISGGCAPRDGWAAISGDCNENYATIFPDAEEVCNERDDDCDGEIDEGTVPRPLYVDADGDGFGVSAGSMMGCLPPPGYAELDGDCDDLDPERHPELAEVCDNKDNDCNERVDEGARLRCGTGWCERLASSCNSECFPGEPRAEECNAFDDDCDGVIDNDASGCEAGLVCYAGACILPEDAEVVSELPDDMNPGAVPNASAVPDPGAVPNPAAVPNPSAPTPGAAPNQSGEMPGVPVPGSPVNVPTNSPAEPPTPGLPAETGNPAGGPAAAPVSGPASGEMSNAPESSAKPTSSCQLGGRAPTPWTLLIGSILLLRRRGRSR